MKDSCGLEYELWYTKKGREINAQRKGSNIFVMAASNSYSYNYATDSGWDTVFDDTTSSSSWLPFVGFAVVVYLMYKYCLRPDLVENESEAATGWGGGYAFA